MDADISPAERRLLTTLQDGFPLVSRPFIPLAEVEEDWDEKDALDHVVALKESGVIRQIGGIFDTTRLGYSSTLVAAKIIPERLDAVAKVVGRHPGVSHNYSRNHAYNLWFTLAVPPGQDVQQQARILGDLPGVDDLLLLPRIRTFKLRVRFDFSSKQEPGSSSARSPENAKGTMSDSPDRGSWASFDPADIPLVRALQKDLPLELRPFDALARESGLDEQELIAGAHRLLAQGFLRRYSAVLRHRRAGYRANAMVCWKLESERIIESGEAAARNPAVSHCYQRVAHPPRWPYQLYTMVHAQSQEELARTIAALETVIQPLGMAALHTVREYKKVRLCYFV